MSTLAFTLFTAGCVVGIGIAASGLLTLTTSGHLRRWSTYFLPLASGLMLASSIVDWERSRYVAIFQALVVGMCIGTAWDAWTHRTQ